MKWNLLDFLTLQILCFDLQLLHFFWLDLVLVSAEVVQSGAADGFEDGVDGWCVWIVRCADYITVFLRRDTWYAVEPTRSRQRHQSPRSVCCGDGGLWCNTFTLETDGEKHENSRHKTKDLLVVWIQTWPHVFLPFKVTNALRRTSANRTNTFAL